MGRQVPGGPSWAYRNSGVMIHCQPPETMGVGQDFPISIEVQLLGGNGKDRRPNANVCTPGTNIVMEGKLITTHCIESSSETLHGDQWVRVEAEVDGGKVVRHRVNGKEVLHYEQPQIGGGSVSGFDSAVKQDGKLLEGGYLAAERKPPGGVPQAGDPGPVALTGLFGIGMGRGDPRDRVTRRISNPPL